MKKGEMRLKSPDEIEKLALGGKILRGVLEEVVSMVKPGVTGLDLDAYAEKRLREQGAEPSFKDYSPSGDPADAFPATLCISRNSAVVHGIPDDVPFEEGDIVGFDIGCLYQGLFTDTATTVPVGKVSPLAKKLISITKQSLQAAIDIVKPGVTTGDIGAAVQKVAENAGFSVVRSLVGHGVGYEIHEQPSVPNYGKNGQGITLPEGAVIAIEPMLVEGHYDVDVADDGWTVFTVDGTLSAHEELTVAIVQGGVRVLTKN